MFTSTAFKAALPLTMLLVCSAAASAAPAQYTRQVSVAGLDLATENGQAALHHRLTVEAQKLCQQTQETTSVDRDDVEECRARAVSAAWTEAQPLIASAQTRNMVATLATR